MEFAPFLIVIVVAIAAIWIGLYLKAKRRQEMQAFALKNGLQFATEDPFQILGWPFELFKRGDGRGVENVAWGPWQGNQGVTVCDYWYYDESTDSEGRRSRSYRRFSCATLEVPAAFPHLEVAREGVFSRLADHLGFEDIELESPEFNRRYNVKAKQRKVAYDVLDARMIEWLVAFDQGLAFELVGNRVLAYSKKRKPSELVPLIGTLVMFQERVPRVAWRLYPNEGRGT
jgi:hypothetical protein